MKKSLSLGTLITSGKVEESVPVKAPLPLGSHQGGGMLFAVPPPPADARTTGGAEKISLALIDDSPYQPRDFYDPIEIDHLSNSLKAGGLEEPILLRPKAGGRYELIAGHRRTRAARTLDWTEIDAYVVIRTDREAQLAAMRSNESRVDLTDYERAKLYQDSIDFGFARTQTEIANLFGTTQSYVSRRMAMLKLPQAYIVMLDAKPGMFGVTGAEMIAQLLKEHPEETALIERSVLRITEEGAAQASIKQWVLSMIGQRNSPGKAITPAIVRDSAGRAMFTSKRSQSGREFTIRIQSTQLSADEVEEIVMEALRKRVTTTP
jgi:ParB/RepB/Spo0J family partition protein